MRTVTHEALQRRINRVLAKKGQRLCKSRPGSDLGEYHLIDVYQNEVKDTHVNLTRLAVEAGCLGYSETAT